MIKTQDILSSNFITRLVGLVILGVFILLQPPVHALEVSKSQVEAAVLAHVKSAIQNHVAHSADTHVNVEVVNLPGFPITLEHAKTVAIDTDSSLGQHYSDRAVVRVNINNPEGGESREIGVPIKITIKKSVWVAKGVISAKEPLNPGLFTLQTKEVSHQFSHSVGREANLSEYIARVNIQAGEMLDNRKIVIPPDVTRNTDITIILSNGKGMNIAIFGTALGDGKIGQQIRVKQHVNETVKYYTAKIIDKNRVLVQI